jgi:hypothetical protein
MMAYNPLCGSDGRTYINLCGLNLANCRSGNRVEFIHLGECGTYVGPRYGVLTLDGRRSLDVEPSEQLEGPINRPIELIASRRSLDPIELMT